MRTYFARIVLPLFLAAAASPAATAQPGPATAFSFLRLEPSARAASLAGTTSATYGDDVSALFHNPALLNESMHRALSVSYLNHVAGIHVGNVAHARRIEHIGMVGAGFRYVSWGQLDGFDQTGAEANDVTAGDAALTISWAASEREVLRYGANLHTVFSRIGSYTASAVGADIGAAYHHAESGLTASASAHNVGIVLDTFGASRDALPLDLRVGISKRLQYVPLLISVAAYNLNHLGADAGPGGTFGDALRHVAVGGEFQFSDSFNVRVGYNHRRHQDLKMKSRLDMAGLGLGFGIKVSTFRFDYAYSSWSTLGGLHLFTVRTVI